MYELTLGVQKVLINHLFAQRLRDKEDTIIMFLEKGAEKDSRLTWILESLEKARSALETYEMSKKFAVEDGIENWIQTASQFSNTIEMLT